MIKDTSTEWARQMAASLRDDRCDPAADLLLSIAEERDAAVDGLAAAGNVLSICKKDAVTSGLSWGGKNVIGDKASIDYAKKAFHYYEQMEALRGEWKERLSSVETALSEATDDIVRITRTAIEERERADAFEAQNKKLRDAWNRLSTTIEVAFSEDGIYGVSSETSLQNVWLACRDLSASLKKEMKS